MKDDNNFLIHEIEAGLENLENLILRLEQDGIPVIATGNYSEENLLAEELQKCQDERDVLKESLSLLSQKIESYTKKLEMILK